MRTTQGIPTFHLTILALLVHSIAAWFSVGWHHPDEHYQLIEFTYAITGEKNAATLPMEFGEEMRPSIQVWLTYVLIKCAGSLQLTNPFLIAFLLRLLTAVLCIVASLQFHRALIFSQAPLQRTHLLLLFFGWCLVYVHVRYSSETWSAALFIWGVSLLLRSKYNLWTGVLLGLSFVFRFQMGFALFGVGAYLLVQRISLKHLLWLSTGGLLSIGFASFLDFLFYGNWVFTPYIYFYQNIVNKVAAGFGISPWYWYFTQTVEQLIPPFSLLVIAGCILLLYQRAYRLIGYALFFFVMGHSMVGHKELRFIFPMLFFAPLAAVLAWQWVYERLKQERNKRRWTALARMFIAVNAVALLIIMFKPAHELANVYKIMYQLPAGSTMYYEHRNPFMSGTNQATFYKNNDLLVIPLSVYKPVTNAFVITEKSVVPHIPHATLSRVYTSIPDWLYAFNVNNWIGRSNQYTLYKITSD
jgi:phosphatidylinositol glycan class B